MVHFNSNPHHERETTHQSFESESFLCVSWFIFERYELFDNVFIIRKTITQCDYCPCDKTKNNDCQSFVNNTMTFFVIAFCMF